MMARLLLAGLFLLTCASIGCGPSEAELRRRAAEQERAAAEAAKEAEFNKVFATGVDAVVRKLDASVAEALGRMEEIYGDDLPAKLADKAMDASLDQRTRLGAMSLIIAYRRPSDAVARKMQELSRNDRDNDIRNKAIETLNAVLHR